MRFGHKWLEILNRVCDGYQDNDTQIECSEVLLKFQILITGDEYVELPSANRNSAPFWMFAQPISGTVLT